MLLEKVAFSNFHILSVKLCNTSFSPCVIIGANFCLKNFVALSYEMQNNLIEFILPIT
jgi:hypothetical protein